MSDYKTSTLLSAEAAIANMPRKVNGQRIGEMLVDQGLVDRSQLEAALQEQQKSKQHEYLGIILMRRKAVAEKDVFQNLSKQHGLEFHDIREREIPPEIVEKIPREIALAHQILPVDYKDGELSVTMEDPFNKNLLRLLQRVVPEKIKTGFATRGDLHYAINRIYNNLVRSNPLVKDFFDGFAYLSTQTPFDANKIIDMILAVSHLLEVSDIHMTFHEARLDISLRIDGTLHPMPIPTRRMSKEHVSQLKNALKIRSKIDVSKRGIPQDGRIELQIENGNIEARVSTLPLIDAEKVVLRLIGHLKVMNLDSIGLSDHDSKRIKPFLKKPAGLILVAGPTGSGKTTSLYALLSKMPTASRNVITIEDPVEARLSFASQVQVKREQGLTFQSALRAIFRQDPDIILLGEIRDQETAEIAVESALTGHMVMASVHMEHAAGTILRMLNMDVEPFALGAALSLIIAQRLVPAICPKCREPHPKSVEFSREMRLPEARQMYHGKGCEKCYFTGRSGRVALFETIVITDEMRDIISKDPTLTAITQQARKHGARSFREDAILKCLQGRVMPEDVLVYS